MAFEILTGILKPNQKPTVVRIPRTTVANNVTLGVLFSLLTTLPGQYGKVEVQLFAEALNARAAYKITGAFKNVAGTITLVGTPTVVSLEDTSAWDATLAINNTSKTVDVKVTSDVTTPTIFWGVAEILLA